MNLLPQKPGVATTPKMKSYSSSRSSGLFGKRVENKSLTSTKSYPYKFRNITDVTEKGALRWRTVYSTGKRSVLIRYLFLKYIYQELTKEEYFLFLSFTESTSTVPIFFALLAKINKVPKVIVRRILENIQFQNFKIISLDEYKSLKSIKFLTKEEFGPPPKKQKSYSGYSRGFKDGRRRSKSKVEEFGSSPLRPGPIFENEIAFLLDFALSVKSSPRSIMKYINLLKGDLHEDGRHSSSR